MHTPASEPTAGVMAPPPLGIATWLNSLWPVLSLTRVRRWI